MFEHPASSVHASDFSVPHGRHICLLYGDEHEQLRTIAAFFAAALRGRHKLLYITDVHSPDDVRRRFFDVGVDLSASSGADVRTSMESYYPNGRFKPEVMCEELEEFARSAVRDGFGGSRCTGEMGWAARKIPGSERLIEYERMLTGVIEQLPFSGICQYDVRLFDGPTILGVLEAHPYLLVRGQILRNPNFVRWNASPKARPGTSDERVRV